MINELSTDTLVTDGDEQDLDVVTIGTSVVIAMDLSDMELGDNLTIRTYVKIVSAGSELLHLDETLSGVQSSPAYMSIPIASAHSLRVTAEMSSSAPRSLPWSMLSLG